MEGLQKNVENIIFFKILIPSLFKINITHHVINKITSAKTVREREETVRNQREWGFRSSQAFLGLNLVFSKDGLTRLFGVERPTLDPAFERGADHLDTIAALHDPPKSRWLPKFVSERIDGVILIAGRDPLSTASASNDLAAALAGSVKIVYSEMGNVRPGKERGHEHFGFLDNISQPGIRGLTPASEPRHRPDQGLPGQDLIWPGEFVFGYPGQHPDDPQKPGPPPPMAAPWMKNGSFMVFRRLEQKVPEFRRFVAENAARLGMDRELLAARTVGRWKSGAPMELAPLRDDPRLGGDDRRNNDFAFGDDPLQRKCPYAGHIRKAYPRDDTHNEAEIQRHRIIRRGIPFGPEVEPGETVTRKSRGLMFVCYQTSIERQFEWIQRRFANNPDFAPDKRRPTGGPVTPGWDPIIGQAPGGGPRTMDEPYPNYPGGSRRTTLDMPHEFVVLTAAAYFFMPSISALRAVLT